MGPDIQPLICVSASVICHRHTSNRVSMKHSLFQVCFVLLVSLSKLGSASLFLLSDVILFLSGFSKVEKIVFAEGVILRFC